MSGTQEAAHWRFLISPKWLGWHLLMVIAVGGMLALGDWQYHRALSGNALSWAYTFEWPIFAGFAFVFWFKTIRDEFRLPAPAGVAVEVDLPPGVAPAAPSAGDAATAFPAGDAAGEQEETAGEQDPDDDELAAYNAYLARLTKEVKGHGKWHGIR